MTGNNSSGGPADASLLALLDAAVAEDTDGVLTSAHQIVVDGLAWAVLVDLAIIAAGNMEVISIQRATPVEGSLDELREMLAIRSSD